MNLLIVGVYVGLTVISELKPCYGMFVFIMNGRVL